VKCFPSGFPTKIPHSFHSSHACYMPCPSHPPFDYSNFIWRRVQIVGLLNI
jgi:hypothetical protein